MLKENEPNELVLSATEEHDLIESMTNLLHDYAVEHPKMYCTYQYKEDLSEYLHSELYELFEYLNAEHNTYADIEDEVDILADKILHIFYTIVPKRSLKSNYILVNQTDTYKDHIKQKLDIVEMKDKLQPEQRTTEWYQRRYNLLSASTAWKAIDRQSYKNALILEKCKPLNTDKYNYVNMNSPMHWGQKYEPVSQMYYEYMYGAVVREYGCIPHSEYSFLGASPDGIIVNRECSRYGRMLEIKNIVNREITGIPKKEYWVQTQMQMECCDLDECDFLECRFKEYDCEEDFEEDGSFKTNNEGFPKGIILHFYNNSNNKPHYEYAPYQCDQAEFESWREKVILEHGKGKTLVRNIYWRLEEVSCVLIQRNRTWFNGIVEEMQELWQTIEKERVEGYDHRYPQKKGKRDPNMQAPSLNINTKSMSLLNVFKLGKKDTDVEESVKNVENEKSESESSPASSSSKNNTSQKQKKKIKIKSKKDKSAKKKPHPALIINIET
jgi:putative phage-type endonuclease